MFEAVQDFDLNDKNFSSRRVQKLQMVKLLFIALTFGFSLTVIILVSEDKSFFVKIGLFFLPTRFSGNIDEIG